MELTGYLAVARRWWWTLLVATWVAAVAGFVVASTIPATYEARTQLLVGPFNTDRETLSAAGSLVQTYSELVTTAPLLESAIAEVGVDLTADDLAAATRATANDTTRFLTIRVQHTDPAAAARLANALAEEISVRASGGINRPEGQLQVVDFAVPPVDPIAPQRSLIVGLAAAAALIGAMVLVMLVEYLSAAVRSEDEVERLTELPSLGRVDTARTLPPNADSLLDSAPDSAAAAAYRLVVAKVSGRGDREHPVRSMVVVGTGSDGTPAQVAANLAAITARGGRQVVLIDTDTATSPVTRIFGLEGRPGLTDVATGRDDVSGVYRASATLRVVPRGTTADDDAIDLARATAIMSRLTEEADLVVISTGPLHLSAGALVWSQVADRAIIVATRDQSRRDDLTYAVESLRLVGAEIGGTVVAERRRSLGKGRGRAPTRTSHADASALDRMDPEPLLASPRPAQASRPVTATRRARVTRGAPEQSTD